MSEIDRWFVDQILPLESGLNAYLRRACSDPADVADLRQEIYVRVYKSACRQRPAVARYFLFSVARNLLIDRMRKNRVVPIDLMADLDALSVLSDDISAERILSGRQELARLEAALDTLPARCRETFVLRKVEGYSQRDTARHMGISEATVEKQMVKAMRILADRFLDSGVGVARVQGEGVAQPNDKRR